MEGRRLGSNGPHVSAIGLGCMGLSQWYEPGFSNEVALTLRTAVDSGVTLFDSSDAYGPYLNEELLGTVLRDRRDDIVLSTMVGVVRHGAGTRLGFDASPVHIRQSVESSLRRLRTDRIDLYYLQRLDPRVPLEDSIGAMSQLVEQGKVVHIGICDVTGPELQAAHAVHPITALQTEYSLWTRDAETDGTLEVADRLGVGVVPYSPLARGLLTGCIRAVGDLAPDDERRRTFPRFAPLNMDWNVALADRLVGLAAATGATAAQLALAWLLARGSNVVPIPGTKRVEHLVENLAALQLVPSSDLMELLDIWFPQDICRGAARPHARPGPELR